MNKLLGWLGLIVLWFVVFVAASTVIHLALDVPPIQWSRAVPAPRSSP